MINNSTYLPHKDGLQFKEEFQKARKILALRPDTRLSKKRDERVNNSYIHNPENGHTYRLIGNRLAEKNGESRSVKSVEAVDGKEYAVKVAVFTYPAKAEQLLEVQVLKKLGRLQDVILRKLPAVRPFTVDYDPNNKRSVDITHHLYIVQNKIPGMTLRSWLEKNKHTTSAMQQVLFAISKALANLHQHGIIHGDIKPDNIMIYEDNGLLKAEFVDFGNSRIVQSGQTEVLTNDFGGTATYRAPESETMQLDNKYVYTVASDIYSLGKLMSEDLKICFTDGLEDRLVLEDRAQRASLYELTGATLESIFSTQAEGGISPKNTYTLASLFEEECLNNESLSHYISSKYPNIFIQALSGPNKKLIKQLETSYKLKSDSFHIGPLFKSKSIVSKILVDWGEHKNIANLLSDLKKMYRNNKERTAERRFAQDFLSALHCIQGEYVLNRDVQEAIPKLVLK